MANLAQIEEYLREMGCPRCYSMRLEVCVQLETENGLPRVIVVCQQCGFRFETNGEALTWEALEKRIEREVRRKGCPRCGSHRLELNFRCSLESRRSFHVATCEECGAVFIVEKQLDEPRPGIFDI